MTPPTHAAAPDGSPPFGSDAAASGEEAPSGWASLRAPRIGVFLSAPLTSPAQVKDRWLVQLRWLALGGMTATVVTARLLVPDLRLAPLIGVLALVLATNLAWSSIVRGRRPGDHRAK